MGGFASPDRAPWAVLPRQPHVTARAHNLNDGI